MLFKLEDNGKIAAKKLLKIYIGYTEEKRQKLVTGNVKIELENNQIDD